MKQAHTLLSSWPVVIAGSIAGAFLLVFQPLWFLVVAAYGLIVPWLKLAGHDATKTGTGAART